MIKLDYKSGQPIFEQITQGIKDLVISGVLTPDEKLPSVRELSVSLTVNPNTVQRAYKTLENEGIIYSIQGKGNFIEKIPEISTRQLSSLYNTLRETVKELSFYGEEKEKIDYIITEIYNERNDKDD